MGKFADELDPVFADSAVATLADFAEGSLAWLIQRVIEDIASNPSMKQLNERYLYHLAFLQQSSLGKRKVHGLKKQDFIDYAKARRRDVSRSTVLHDLTKIRAILKYARANWADCEELKTDGLDDAKEFLASKDIVGKGNTRTRLATDAEQAQLIAYFEAENARGQNTVKGMPDVIRFACISSRRRSEITRLKLADVDFEKQIYWVRDMKHPTKKKGNDKFFTLWPELAAIIRRQPIHPSGLVFPYNSNVIGQKFGLACRALGIVDLHFHDLRATAISWWILRGMPIEDVRVCVSGHDTTVILERVYDRRTAEDVASEKYGAWLRMPPQVSPPSPPLAPAGAVVETVDA